MSLNEKHDDSLDYVLKTAGWWKFLEGSNQLIFNIKWSCTKKRFYEQSKVLEDTVAAVIEAVVVVMVISMAGEARNC